MSWNNILYSCVPGRRQSFLQSFPAESNCRPTATPISPVSDPNPSVSDNSRLVVASYSWNFPLVLLTEVIFNRDFTDCIHVVKYVVIVFCLIFCHVWANSKYYDPCMNCCAGTCSGNGIYRE